MDNVNREHEFAVFVGSHIREGRKAAGLTQEQLADLMEVKPLAVSRWETGDRLPSEDKRAKLASLLVRPELAYASLAFSTEIMGDTDDDDPLDKLRASLRAIGDYGPLSSSRLTEFAEAMHSVVTQPRVIAPIPEPNAQDTARPLTTDELVSNISVLVRDHARERETLLRQLDAAAEERSRLLAMMAESQKMVAESQRQAAVWQHLIDQGHQERLGWQALLDKYAPPDLRSAWQTGPPGQAPTRPPRPAPEGDIPIEHLPPEQSRTKAAMHTAKPQRAKKK